MVTFWAEQTKKKVTFGFKNTLYSVSFLSGIVTARELSGLWPFLLVSGPYFVVSYSSWCQRRVAIFDCGTPCIP